MSSLDEDLTVAKLKIAAIEYVLSKGTIGSIENNYIVLYNGTSKEQLWEVMSDLQTEKNNLQTEKNNLQTEKNNLQTEKNNLLKMEIALIEKESLEIRAKTQQSGMSSTDGKYTV